MTAGPAVPGRPAVADALIHVAVVGPHDLAVAGVAGREDALAVVVDREPVDAARDEQPQQSGQDGRHVHQVQDGAGDEHISRRAVRAGRQVTAEFGVHEAHPEITYQQPVRQRVTAHAPGGRPVAQPPAGTVQQLRVRIQQDVLTGGDRGPVHQAGHHRPQAGADLKHPRRTRGHEAAQPG